MSYYLFDKKFYSKKDAARYLYQELGWHIKEIEKKIGIKCTPSVVPSWMRDLRNKREIDYQRREERNRLHAKKMLDYYYREKSLEEKELAKKLKKADVKKVKKMINQIAPVNAFNQGRSNQKRCVVNNYLSRKW